MGMFDRIKCDFEIAEKEIQNNEFQTKDLECFLNDYLITKEGRILLLNEDGNTDLEFHGDLIFYTNIGKHPKDENWVWYSLKARFTEGQLQWIKRINI